MKIVTLGIVALSLITTFVKGEIRDKDWWNHAIIYEVYPRSFMDTDNDGIGDLQGVAKKLTYLADSGVQAVWLTNINRSPMEDLGNDVSDFKDVDKSFGKLEDFDFLIDEAKELGLKVILDVIPNHTSDQHYWFQESVKSEGKYADYYIWATGRNSNKLPPNNWISLYGGPAWTYNNERKMWYFHQYGPKEPDLNYYNANVKEEMKEILLYWLGKGVDGFCMRTMSYIFEDESLRNEMRSKIHNVSPMHYLYLNHTYTKDRFDTWELVKSWRHILDEYANYHNSSEKILMTKAHTDIPNNVKFYNAGSHVPLNLKFIEDVYSGSTATEFKRVIDDWMRALPRNGIPNWALGNEEHSRLASRFPDRIDQMTMLGMILPGVVITYYGDEIGMTNNMNISFNETMDPIARIAGPLKYNSLSRDPYRTPFQWDSSTNAGFSNTKAWLPVNRDYPTVNLASQKMEYESHYKVYQKLAYFRRNLAPLQNGSLVTNVLKNDVLSVVRNTTKQALTLLINFSNRTDHRIELPYKSGDNAILVSSVRSGIKPRNFINKTTFLIPAKSSVILQTNLTGNSNSGASRLSFSHMNFVLISIFMLLIRV